MLKEYFDKIYCINLDRRKDRWEETIEELNKWGITDQVTRFSAIDGGTVSEDEKNYPINSGELGILLTHEKIINECIVNNYSKILILEDDIEFTNDIKNFNEFYEVTPKKWDMIYFGGNHNKHMGKKLNLINDKIIKLNETYGIHCIAIDKNMFNPILNIIKNKRKPIDVYYADLQKGYDCYGFHPSIALQRVSYSDIQNKVMDYKWLF